MSENFFEQKYRNISIHSEVEKSGHIDIDFPNIKKRSFAKAANAKE